MNTCVLAAEQISVPFESAWTWIAIWLGQPKPAVENAAGTLFVGAMCATGCALVGCLLLLRRMSLLGDALSHSVLAGVACVYLLTGRIEPLPMFLGALAAGVVTAVATQVIHRTGSVPEDSSIGIVFTSLFAFGVVVVSQAKGVHLDLDCVLFGNLAFAGMNFVPTMGWLLPEATHTVVPALLITVLVFVLFWKELRLTSFDVTLAATLGFSVPVMHYLMTTIVALVTVSAMEVVGLLVVALLTVPACIARMLTDRLERMLLIAVLSGISCTTLGYFLALRWNSSAAGLTAVTAGAELLAAILVAPRYGILGRLIRSVQLKVRIAAEDILAALFRRRERAGTIHPESISECRTLAGNGFAAHIAVYWLGHRGLLVMADGTAQLSEKGQRYAQDLVRAHRLWESWLDQNFDLPSDHLHDPAETMEHFIGPQILRQLEEDLDQPSADPHGREIPKAP
ncbi:MAG: metal ABC transporter permease [Fuerstiella sp.]|nr:metal ABC transporter permease [Fuerstiella sp.]